MSIDVFQFPHVGYCEDLPTPPFGHPSLEKVLYLGKPQDRTFRSEEGIFTPEF
jgi:hypothetical protein